MYRKPWVTPTIDTSSGWPKMYFSGIAITTRTSSPTPVTHAATR
jgi:hypothetical protein